ncbi:MAG TPA: hypothetical protein VEA19_02580 [Actinomycetota bacterium]|nr:hypothetical protein [Actinomycetota bacterium]
MKIRGKCTHCGRDFLVDELDDTAGHCPTCGKAFTRDYTPQLVQALFRAQAAGSALEDALEDMAGMELWMELDEETVTEPLRKALAAARRRRARAVR